MAVNAQKVSEQLELEGSTVAFPNSNYTDILATTIESRSQDIRDNVTKNNALLAQMKRKGRIRTFSGGHKILEVISFSENGNAGWYSGFDTLPVSPQDVISAAEYEIKQLACPVVIDGLTMIKNSGKEALIDLFDGRLEVAEATMANMITDGLYSDGTGTGGKEITGLDAAVPQDPTTGTYGGINRADYTFWRSQLEDPGSTPTTSTIQASMNALYAKCQRGADRPDLIIAGSTIWATFLGSLQALQRFASADSAKLGFPSIEYMGADVVLDGGIGGFATATDMYFLNTRYLSYRPFAGRDMVPLSPEKRYAVNQDAVVQIIAWAGNMTCGGARFQGRLKGD